MILSALSNSTGALHLLGWSLLHFLWQAALIALALNAVLTAARNSSAQARYALCCAALALMALCPVVTFAWLACRAAEVAQVVPIAAGTGIHPLNPSQAASIPLLERVIAMTDKTMPWILSIWITGVLLLLTRTIVAGIAVRKMKTRAILPAPEGLLALARRIGERLKITQLFHIRLSHAVTAPTVIGWLKPVILFPVASLTGLAPEQLEAMLAHELAHIQRRDYLVNALQVAMETLLFYHPAVWWVSQKIRREREHCCDDIAVSITGSPLVYARALYLLEQQRAIAPELTLGANGGQLKMRIQRLLTGKQPAAGSYGGTMWLLTAALLLITAGLAVSTLTINKATAQSPSSPALEATTATGQVVRANPSILHLLKAPEAKYPAIARAAHISGHVSVAVIVSSKGNIAEAHVLRGEPMLRQAALDAVRQYKFAPFEDSGYTGVKLTIEVNFVQYDKDGKASTRPDLSCTYYGGVPFAGHKGTCERDPADKTQYLCRENDDDNHAESQIGCEHKVEAFEAWKSQQSLLDSREQFLRAWDTRRSNQ